jgi:hypothetical protein
VMKHFKRGILYIILVLEVSSFDFFWVSTNHLPVDPDVFNSHLVLGKCSCFVRTNTWSRAQSFNSLKILH